MSTLTWIIVIAVVVVAVVAAIVLGGIGWVVAVRQSHHPLWDEVSRLLVRRRAVAA